MIISIFWITRHTNDYYLDFMKMQRN